MKATFKVFRFDPEKEKESGYQTFEVEVEPGDVLLTSLHKIHDEQDGSLAYRYSCRGAICGSCAVRINGRAALACKTQVMPLLENGGTIMVGPLTNHYVLKDLVVEMDPFWEAIDQFLPWLHREKDEHDKVLDYGLDNQQMDQLDRSGSCIRCASCYSDCPKVTEEPNFIGPAAGVVLYRFRFDPRDRSEAHDKMCTDPMGPLACDKHAVCVKVCPKDVQPLRAITMIQRDTAQ